MDKALATNPDNLIFNPQNPPDRREEEPSPPHVAYTGLSPGQGQQLKDSPEDDSWHAGTCEHVGKGA